jgi:hypothetical protein
MQQQLESVDVLTAENVGQLSSRPYRCRDIASGAVPAALRLRSPSKFKAEGPYGNLFKIWVEEGPGMICVKLEFLLDDADRCVEMLRRIFLDFPGKNVRLEILTLECLDVWVVPAVCALPGLKDLSIYKIDGYQRKDTRLEVQPHYIERVSLHVKPFCDVAHDLFAGIIGSGRALEWFEYRGDVSIRNDIALAVQKCPTLRHLGNRIEDGRTVWFEGAPWMVGVAALMKNIRSLHLDTSMFRPHGLVELSERLTHLEHLLDLSLRYDWADDHSAAALLRNIRFLKLKTFSINTAMPVDGACRHGESLHLLRTCKSLERFDPAIADKGWEWLVLKVMNEIAIEGRVMYVNFYGQQRDDIEKTFSDPTPLQRFMMIAATQNRRLENMGPYPKRHVSLRSMTEEDVAIMRQRGAPMTTYTHAPEFVGLTVERLLKVLSEEPKVDDFSVCGTDLAESFLSLVSGIKAIRPRVRRLEFTRCNLAFEK